MKKSPKSTKRSATGVEAKAPAPLAAFLRRWQDGEQLAALAAEAKIKRSKFRRLMIAALGGKDAFRAARADGAGGRRRVPGGARTTTPRAMIDDSTVKRLKSGGWTARRVWVPRLIRLKLKDAAGEKGTVVANWRECEAMIFVSPKGNEYVRATPGERADAIIRTGRGLPDVRLKRFADSRVASRVERVTADAEQLAAKVARIKKQDKAKRESRRAARKSKTATPTRRNRR